MRGLAPARAVVVNVTTGERIEVLANPEELSEVRSATFARPAVIGLGHRPMHYTGSENARIQKLTLWIDAHVAAERGGAFDVDGFAGFLRAFTVPPLVGGEPGSEPPRLLLVWPGLLSLQGFVTGLELRYTQFAESGEPIRYTASLDLEEALDVARYSGDLRGG